MSDKPFISTSSLKAFEELTERQNLSALEAELLEALENMVNIYYGRGGTKSDAISFSEKAIAKAKGESNGND